MSEDKLNPVISLSGSSPAYVFLFIKIMCDWAKEKGFSEKEAKELVCSAFTGSADLLRYSETSPDELIRDVSSPGGTTLQALAQFEKHGIAAVIRDALDACEKRAIELSK
jgi:pyrroline-5-carboxylate reductase